MLFLLPAVTFVSTTLAFARTGFPYRKALLAAAVCCGVGIALSTELLSLLHAIAFVPVAALWGVAAAISAGLLCRGKIGFSRPGAEAGGLLLGGVGLVLATTFLVAILSPPNNWDSMTYHMARVAHWIQNRSVAHYPTHITRQLYSAPWAEYAVMHLQILTGGDRFANLVQWGALCGSVVGTSLVALELGAPPVIQGLAAVVTATIPMGILQASSTQNDYVVAFWLVCFVYFALQLAGRNDFFTTFACGASLGLAILTKGTAYIFALPFVAWLFLSGVKTGARYLRSIAVVAVVVAVVNGGYYWRNYTLWGNPLATDQEHLANTEPGIGATLSNVARNVASNTWTPFESVNGFQFAAVTRLHSLFGVDPDDPRTSLADFQMGKSSLDEDYAGNGIHLLLAAAALAILAARRRSVSKSLLLYGISLASGFLLFCILLKWQPWGTRLQLPLFVLAAPLIALALPPSLRRCGVPTVAAILLLSAVPWLFANETRPLWGASSILKEDRESLYFAKRPQLEPYYRNAADQIARQRTCTAVGIVSRSGNSYEYPLWPLLRKRGEKMPRIEHVDVTNASGSIPLRDFRPCVVFEAF